MKNLYLVIVILGLSTQFSFKEKTETSSENNSEMSESPKLNALTETEKAEGWQLLFDGQTTNGWRRYNAEDIGQKWQAVDGSLKFVGSEGNLPASEGGDIITTEKFENFELNLEWKISANGNSGLFFNVVESEEYAAVYFTGPEMQVLDNDGHPDAQIHTHRAGDLYDLIACSEETVKAVGEWNRVRVLLNQGHLEFWLNEAKVVETEMWTDEWNEMVANSKFSTMPAFARAKSGHLALQDHGDPVWFRNIKLKKL